MAAFNVNYYKKNYLFVYDSFLVISGSQQTQTQKVWKTLNMLRIKFCFKRNCCVVLLRKSKDLRAINKGYKNKEHKCEEIVYTKYTYTWNTFQINQQQQA